MSGRKATLKAIAVQNSVLNRVLPKPAPSRVQRSVPVRLAPVPTEDLIPTKILVGESVPETELFDVAFALQSHIRRPRKVPKTLVLDKLRKYYLRVQRERRSAIASNEYVLLAQDVAYATDQILHVLQKYGGNDESKAALSDVEGAFLDATYQVSDIVSSFRFGAVGLLFSHPHYAQFANLRGDVATGYEGFTEFFSSIYKNVARGLLKTPHVLSVIDEAVGSLIKDDVYQDVHELSVLRRLQHERLTALHDQAREKYALEMLDPVVLAEQLKQQVFLAGFEENLVMSGHAVYPPYSALDEIVTSPLPLQFTTSDPTLTTYYTGYKFLNRAWSGAGHVGEPAPWFSLWSFVSGAHDNFVTKHSLFLRGRTASGNTGQRLTNFSTLRRWYGVLMVMQAFVRRLFPLSLSDQDHYALAYGYRIRRRETLPAFATSDDQLYSLSLTTERTSFRAFDLASYFDFSDLNRALHSMPTASGTVASTARRMVEGLSNSYVEMMREVEAILRRPEAEFAGAPEAPPPSSVPLPSAGNVASLPTSVRPGGRRVAQMISNKASENILASLDRPVRDAPRKRKQRPLSGRGLRYRASRLGGLNG